MLLVEIIKATGPAMVGAISAILSSWLTNRFAERRFQHERFSRERELKQRTLEALMPSRLKAYQDLFKEIELYKTNKKIDEGAIERMSDCLLWVNPEISKEIVEIIKKGIGNDNYRISQMNADLSRTQLRIRSEAGIDDLDELIAEMRERSM